MKFLPRILIVLLALLLYSGIPNTRVRAQKPVPKTVPATVFFKFFSEQPDHLGERVIKINNTETKLKYAKKGDKIRYEFYPLDQNEVKVNENYRKYKIVTISQVNHQTLALDPQEKTFSVSPPDFNLISFDVDKIIEAVKSEISRLEVQDFGSAKLEGHNIRKYKMTFQNDGRGIYFYFDEDLKNLFVKMEANEIEEINGSYNLTNASLEVPDELFEVPNDYKKVEFNDLIMNIKQKALK